MIETVATCLQEQHDARLVAAAVLICMVSSATAIYLLGNSHTVRGGSMTVRLLPSIGVTSIGAWATHFVAILGYDTGLETKYSVPLIGLAGLFSFVTVAFGIVFGAYFRSVTSYAVGGLYLGLGISVMHLLGMFAVQVPGSMVFHMPSTIAAIVSGCLISACAFATFARVRSRWRHPAASLLLVLAVCTLHFTQVSWTRFTPSPAARDIEQGIDGTVLAIVVFSLWVFVTVIALARHWSHTLEEDQSETADPDIPAAEKHPERPDFNKVIS